MIQKLPQPFFDENGNLFHLNLLIEDSNGKPLFNHNTSTLLRNMIFQKENKDSPELNFGVPALEAAIKNMQAYKINGHFRLGSKIHITDFYYAKPFFQNSFFAQKYALLLAKHIITELDKSENESIDKFTLVGYGLYSELLVSYVKTLLENYYKSNREILINYNTVSDLENCKLNRPSAKISDNVIIIVPIATTFSTSTKIEKQLRDAHKKDKGTVLNVIQPHLNVLLVVDSSFEQLEGEIKDDSILKKYGWKKIDKTNKIITVKPFNDTDRISVKQKYFFYQTTIWNEIKNCQYCFPDEDCKNVYDKRNCFNCGNACALNEQPLFDTDKTSLSPELILGYPKARKIIENENQHAVLGADTIEYGHFVRNGNHYHYYPDDYKFWEENKNEVRKWLENISKKTILNNDKENISEQNILNNDESKRIVVLSPGHFSNADFVAMVNEVLFDNRATILHYDSAVENTQNFWLFYGKEIVNADKVFFVDDVITSGITFMAANSFLKRIRNEFSKKEEETKGFDACIFLVNRSGHYESEDIERKLGKENTDSIYAYTNLHIPYIKSYNNRCPLCDELDKYKILYKNSYLTKIKLRFLKQQSKLREISIFDKKEEMRFLNEDERGKYYTRSARKAEAVHRIYDWFSDFENNNSKQYLFPIFQNECDLQIDKFSNFREWIGDMLRGNSQPFVTSLLFNEK